MRIGNFIGVAGPPPTLEGRLQQALDTENDGFDSLWDTQIMAADTITMLALVGQATKRIELGTSVVPLIVQRNPVVLAQQALTTQAAAQGRFILGIGAVSRAWLGEQPGLSSITHRFTCGSISRFSERWFTNVRLNIADRCSASIRPYSFRTPLRCL